MMLDLEQKTRILTGLEYEINKIQGNKDYLKPLNRKFLKKPRLSVEEIYIPFTFRDGDLVVLVTMVYGN